MRENSVKNLVFFDVRSDLEPVPDPYQSKTTRNTAKKIHKGSERSSWVPTQRACVEKRFMVQIHLYWQTYSSYRRDTKRSRDIGQLIVNNFDRPFVKRYWFFFKELFPWACPRLFLCPFLVSVHLTEIWWMKATPSIFLLLFFFCAN